MKRIRVVILGLLGALGCAGGHNQTTEPDNGVESEAESKCTEGAVCSDADPCTTDDTCAGGLCVGYPKICDDPPYAMCTDSETLVAR